jgi:hypothetical protein
LSEAELMRIGSSVAYLDISWAKVGDWNARAEIGPAMLQEIVLAGGAGSMSCKKITKSWSVKRSIILSIYEREMNILPLKLVESQTLMQGREDALIHWRYDHETLATKKWRKDE